MLPGLNPTRWEVGTRMMANAEARNLRLLGHHDLAGHGNGGEGMGIHVAGGRRYLYIAHERGPVNFSVVEVTDPRRPRLVDQTRLRDPRLRSNSLAVCAGLLVVAYQVHLEQASAAGTEPGQVGLEVFDLTDPERPRPVGFFDTSGPHSLGVHFVWFVDGRYAYLSTGMPDFEPSHPRDHQIPVIVDLTRPDRPREVGRWWLPGTRRGDDVEPPARHPRFDGGYRAHNVNVYPRRPDRAYVGYLDGGIVVLDISQPSRPRQVSRLDYHPPMTGFTHTVLPLLDRGLLAVTDETVVDGGADHPKHLWLVDCSVESNLTILGTAPLPPAEDFRHRGGRFGPHNRHENDPVEVSWRSEEHLVGAFFNAGVRVYDVRDPFHPREVAYFVPPPPPGSPAGAAQVNDVFVDEKRIVYAVDRFTGGLYLLEGDF